LRGERADDDGRRGELGPGLRGALPPVDNGLDYLVSVVDHLRGEEVGRRELKYAVVHLQAAVECLLKYRLEL
jgi:hypothetical protein